MQCAGVRRAARCIAELALGYTQALHYCICSDDRFFVAKPVQSTYTEKICSFKLINFF